MSLAISWLFELIALDESVNATFGIDNLLLSGIERMAGAANFNTNGLLCRSSLDFSAADA